MSFDVKKFKEEKEKIINFLKNELKSIQTGTATPSVLDMVLIEVYGSKSPISHLASISIESSANLLIVPYDKSTFKEIEKSINEANLGLSLSTDGSGIRVFFPKPTTESRQKMAKVIKEKLEEARVKIRGIREEQKKEIEKNSKEGEISKDEEKKMLEDLQKEVNQANVEVEDICSKKEKDILG